MKSEKELVIQAWFQSANEALFWSKMRNDKLSDLNNHFLTLATIVLPLSGTFLVGFSPVSSVVKTLVILGWISLLTSIVLGLAHVADSVNFFKDYVNYQSIRSTIYFNNLKKTLDDAEGDIKKLRKPKSSSDNNFIPYQALFLFIGLLLVMVAVTTILILK